MKTALPTLTPILVRNQTVLWPLPKIQSIWCSQGKPRSGPPDSDGFVKYRLPAPAEFLLRRWLHRLKATRCTWARNEDTLTKSTTSSCSRYTGADPPTKPWGRTFSVKSRSFHSGSESSGSSPQPGAWRVVSARHVCGYLPPLNVAWQRELYFLSRGAPNSRHPRSRRRSFGLNKPQVKAIF